MSSATQTMPTILVTNDDGVQAPGLLALAQALRPLGQVVVIAPDHNWSAAGHSKTMHKPLRVWSTLLADGTPAKMTTGSPSDCVALAMLGLLPQKPDLVVSGINQGANVGQDLTYSGTFSAAMEAVISGVPAMAMSLDSYTESIFAPGAQFAAHLAQTMLAQAAPSPWLLNVNMPALEAHAIKGVQVTRLGNRLYRDALVTRNDPRGQAYYWIGGDPPDGVADEGTDIGALASGHISVTPIVLDLTDHQRLTVLKDWQLGLPDWA